MDAANQFNSDASMLPIHSIHLLKKIGRMRLIVMLASGLLAGTMSASANAANVISSTTYIDYQLPEKIQDICNERDNCPKIEAKYLKTNHTWINEITNARIDYLLVNSKPTESAPIKTKSSQADVQAALNDFVRSQFTDTPEDRQWAYELMVTPKYLGHVGDVELFEIESYLYTGGAHGMSYSEYLIFDPSAKKQITLDDMLVAGKKSRFKTLAYDAYQAWVKTFDTNVRSYEKNWPFTLSDNVTLTDKGIDILYQPYAIGPYASGMPILSVPYSQLDGVIKPRFIPK
ncbi:RsiV family protein [Psychrobacter sp. B38]|uniref:RsiV family protein n=1 Tax=Psychrobacter sp. B38 TaxID=3143538 RepID=UPI00320CA464